MINIEYDKDKDAYTVPKWLMRSILGYDNELLSLPYDCISDYAKGVVDTLKEQQTTFTINIKTVIPKI
jgi:hypothetical protein